MKRVRNNHRTVRGFTLTEVLIAAVLALVLLLAASVAFQATSETVGAGQAIASAMRDGRAAQAVLRGDLQTVVLDEAPYIIIQNQRLIRFVDANDEKSDSDNNPATLEVDTTSVNATQNPLRSHRIDQLSFFVSATVRAQTGTEQSLVSSISSRDGYVSYGHLRLPAPATISDPRQYLGPGEGNRSNNPWNYDPVNWTLGRSSKLMTVRTRDFDGIDQIMIDTPVRQLLPLMAAGSHAQGGAAAMRPIESSRYDLLLTSLNDTRAIFTDYLRANADSAWWDPFIYRFAANPYPRRDASAAQRADAMALAAPIFMNNCTSFAVEFTGDFVTQKADLWSAATPNKVPEPVADGLLTLEDLNDPECGTVTDNRPDGRPDFILVRSPTGPSIRPRWYGLPRDVDGDGVIRGIASHNNDLTDVVPVRDVIRTNSTLSNASASFERDMRSLPTAADYGLPNALPADVIYKCVFGPDDAKPTHLRIRITVRDPRNRLRDGQTFDYVQQVGR